LKNLRYFVLALAALMFLAPAALARVDFELNDYAVSEFNAFDDLESSCGAPAASSFFCTRLSDTLTRIPTKGIDFFFSDAGELVAAFSKQQRGQNLRSYNVNGGQNLIPSGAVAPGASVLIDGVYFVPEEVEGGWNRLTETEFEGRFVYRVGPLEVTKRVVVSNVSHSLEVDLEVRYLIDTVGVPADAEAGDSGEATTVAGEPLTVQLAFPGIARSNEPVVKIGQGETFSLNPLSQAVVDPSYISIQNNNRNTANAIVMRPTGTAFNISAQRYDPNLIAFQRPLEPGGDGRLAAEIYIGANELVRYNQEGYLELPGLFRPNLLGRLSLAILWFLRSIHDVVGNWGLSIIVLTLIFRAVIWPLIRTQTRSMFGMQELQPKLKALQAKYKDDREKLTQETMALYREAGVNPAGGCLPIVVQMPLFIILWRVFVNFEFNEGFLWVPDLGQADPFYILPAMYVGVMLAMSWFSARGNPQSLRQQILINVVFAFIMVGFPSGVILYFVVSMLIQVIQYWLLSRNKPAPATAK
jgi:YidC/Oxa1 family membrane protein insertase